MKHHYNQTHYNDFTKLFTTALTNNQTGTQIIENIITLFKNDNPKFDTIKFKKTITDQYIKNTLEVK